MRRPTRSVRICTVTAAAFLAFGTSGCDNGEDPSAPSDTASSPDTTSATDSAPTEPSGSTQPTSPIESSPATVESPTPTSHDNSPVGRAQRSQVAAADLPGFNKQWVWDDANGGAGPRGTVPASPRCMQASLTAIGGVVEYSTLYTVAGDTEDQALLMTAVFPDERTAQMAEQVLSSWQGRCRTFLSRQPGVDAVAVTEDRTIRTSVGKGHTRLVGFGPVKSDPDSMYFNGEGYVRDGDVISYLVVHNVGQDYNYADGKEPVALGLLAAASALESSR